MSYARFGWGGSDVYVTLDCDGHLRCWSCGLLPTGSFKAFTTEAMVGHLRGHQAAGDTVCEDTIADLHRDAVENDAWINARMAEAAR